MAAPPAAGATAMELKWKLLRMAAALDRGQAHNPTSGEYYGERLETARGARGGGGASHWLPDGFRTNDIFTQIPHVARILPYLL